MKFRLILRFILQAHLIMHTTCAQTSSRIVQYRDWLKTGFIDDIIQMPGENFEYPVEVKVETDNLEDNCNVTKTYCKAPSRFSDTNITDTPCNAVTCEHFPCDNPDPAPLRDYEINALANVTVTGLPTVNDCEVQVINDHIKFGEADLSRCTKRSASFTHYQSSNAGYTLSFSVNMTYIASRSVFMKITGDTAGGEILEFLMEINDTKLVTLIAGSSELNRIYIKPPFSVSLIFHHDVVHIIFNAILWTRYQIPIRPDKILITFGDNNFIGAIYNVHLYSTINTFAEIFTIHTGKAFPKPVLRPDCECIRRYPYRFYHEHYYESGSGEITNSDYRNSLECFSIFYSGGFGRRVQKSMEPPAIFDSSGWMSDYTESATIYINFPQKTAVYLIEMSLENYPYKAEFSMKAGDLLASVTDSCSRNYNTRAYNFADISSLRLTSFNASSNKDPKTKCYNWEDISFDGQIIIPVVGPDEQDSTLSDKLSGTQLQIHFIGHHADSSISQKWYGVKNLIITGRPTCDGEYSHIPPSETEYVLLPTRMAFYFSPDTKKFKCHCQPNITGDSCEACIPSLDNRYVKSAGICAECGCSDLSISKKCDAETGQCMCRDSEFLEIDKELAGRQCFWYVNKIYPLSGPVSGGTIITITGGYFLNPWTYFNNRLEVAVLHSRSDSTNFSAITIKTPPHPIEYDYVALQIGMKKDGGYQISGPEQRTYTFQYLPNPIIEDILMRKSIQSGGLNLTVTGQYINSVASPQLLVYLERSLIVLHMYSTDCFVKNETCMHCPTPKVNSTYSGGSQESAFRFTIGLKLDGYTEYNYLANSSNEKLHQVSLLQVYRDPVIYEFSNSGILEFKPEDDVTIKIKGEGLTDAALPSDYHISIGSDGECTVKDVTFNHIFCQPPLNVPNHDMFKSVKYKGRNIPHIEVKVGNLKVTVGYIFYKTNIWEDDEVFRVGISVLIAAALIALITLPVTYVCWKRKHHEGICKQNKQSPKMEISLELKTKLSKCTIPPGRLVVNQVVGKGNFGQVYKGQLTTKNKGFITVAVKSLRDDHDVEMEDLERFLKEGTIMMDFRHENVLSLVGVVWSKNERPLVVLPFMEKGDLHTLIKNPNEEYTCGDIIHFSWQISNGMHYLSERKFVHRDLAARNCMVDGSYIVKIADFGLSRDLCEKDYYCLNNMAQPLPLKWMAIESLMEGIYSTKSDVWSYGVTLWELFTRGSTPYPGVDTSSLKSFILSGQRMDQPQFCPSPIFYIMRQCWEKTPESRPTFSEIKSLLAYMLENPTSNDSDYSNMTSYMRLYTSAIPSDYQEIHDEDYNYMCPSTVSTEYLKPNSSTYEPSPLPSSTYYLNSSI